MVRNKKQLDHYVRLDFISTNPNKLDKWEEPYQKKGSDPENFIK